MATTIDLLKNSAFETKMDALIAAITESGGSAVEAKQFTNPVLTASSGVCTWSVAHNIGAPVFYEIVDTVSKENVMATTVVTDNNTLTVKFGSTANIAAGKYQITVIGCEVSA